MAEPGQRRAHALDHLDGFVGEFVRGVDQNHAAALAWRQRGFQPRVAVAEFDPHAGIGAQRMRQRLGIGGVAFAQQHSVDVAQKLRGDHRGTRITHGRRPGVE